MMNKRLPTFVVGLALVSLAGQGASAQYGGYGDTPAKGLLDELKTAQIHAANAARSETLRDSLWHLGHVVNCLEGPRGKDYDAKNLNPCQGQGNGVIPDLESSVQSSQKGASEALNLANKANQEVLQTLKLTNIDEPAARFFWASGVVTASASKAADMLGDALKAIGQ